MWLSLIGYMLFTNVLLYSAHIMKALLRKIKKTGNHLRLKKGLVQRNKNQNKSTSGFFFLFLHLNFLYLNFF